MYDLVLNLGDSVSADEFIARISGTNIGAQAIPRDLVDLFARDFKLASQLAAAAPMITSRILAVVGEADPIIKYEHLKGWEDVTSAQVFIDTIPGNHHYWFDEPSCLRLVETIITRSKLASRPHITQVIGADEKAPAS